MSGRYTAPKTDGEKRRGSAQRRPNRALTITVWVLVAAMVLSLLVLGASAI